MPESLSALQQAFKDNDAFQCGYCTPGQICSATALIDEIKQNWPSHVTTDLQNPDGLLVQEIAERMSGNICRCSAYPNIIKAISQVLENEMNDSSKADAVQKSEVTGIWSLPPSEAQLGSQTKSNKTATSTLGDRS